MKDIYCSPLYAVTNVAGFFIESFFLIYLLSRFFPARQSKAISLWEVTVVAGAVTVGLLAGDLLSSPTWSMAVYTALFYLLPLLYATVRLEGSLPMKTLICLLFVLMNSILESMLFLLQFLALNAFVVFFFRRVLCKVLLYFIDRFLLLGVSHTQVRVSQAYWVSLAVICTSEYLFMMPVLTEPDAPLLFKVLAIATSIFIPLSFYYTVTRLVRVMEENQVCISQNRQLELSQQYMTQVNQLSESLRRFRHDYKSHLFCVDALLAEGKYDQLHQYLMELHQSTAHSLSITQYTLNGPLNIVLNQKAEEARHQAIAFKASVVYPEESHIRDMDLVTILSNLLDNALEAAKGAPRPTLSVDIRREKAYLRVEVVNATIGDVLSDNPELSTTKSDRSAHGLGLKIVHNIIAHYEGMYQVSGEPGTLKTVVLLLDRE